MREQFFPMPSSLLQASTLPALSLLCSPYNHSLLINFILILSNDFTEKIGAISGNINFPNLLVFPTLPLLPSVSVDVVSLTGAVLLSVLSPSYGTYSFILLSLKSSLSPSH